MTNDTRKKILQITEIIISALLLLVGAALAVSCLLIYSNGDRPFSREIISLYFQRISPAVYLLIVAIVAGAAVHALCPSDPARVPAVRDEEMMLESMKNKCPVSDPDSHKSIGKEHQLRKAVKISKVLLIITVFIYPALYLTDPTHFSVSELNGDIAVAAIVVLLAAASAFILSYIACRLESASIQREIKICKEFIARQNPPAKQTDSDQAEKNTMKNEKNFLAVTRIAVFLLAVCFIVMGILNLGIDDVLGKAIRICTECIGLG